jgi:anti-anti-sigma factor
VCCAAELREESPVSSGKILVAQQEGVYLLKLTGDVRVTLCASINDYIEKIFSGPPATAVYVDLLEAEGVDSTTLGLLAKLAVHCIDVLGIKAGLLCVNRNILRILESMELDELFVLLGMPASPELPLRDITPNAGDEPDHELVRRQVLEAHKLLVTLNPRLLGDFVDLINCLEGDGAER